MTETTTETEEPSSYWSLLANNREFRLFYLSSLVSLCGDWFLSVAIYDLVLELTGSGLLMGLVAVAQTLPVFLMTPFSGPLIDALDRRRVMIATDGMRAVAALLPLLAVSTGTIGFAYFGLILISIGAGLFQPAAAAALPNLVSARDLPRASVLFGSIWGAMVAVGAALGGIVVATLGRESAFVIDSLTFIISAVLLLRIRSSFSEAKTDTPPRSIFAAARETFSYARSHPRTLALLTSKSGFGLAAGVVAMITFYGSDIYAAGAFGIGILFSARGLGALAGPFLVRNLSTTPDSQYRKIPAAIVLFGVGYLALTHAPSLALGFLALFAAHMGGGAQWVTSTFGLQNEVPDYIRGRVLSIDLGLVTLTISLSSIATGWLADQYGVPAATRSIALLSVGFAFVWWLSARHLFRETRV